MRADNKWLWVILVCLFGAMPIPVTALNWVDNLSPEAVANIVQLNERRAFDDFNQFVYRLYSSRKVSLTPAQRAVLGKFLTNQAVDPQSRFIIHRLLGIYARLKYAGEARRLLHKTMVLPVYQGDGLERKSANYKKLETLIVETATEFRLKVRTLSDNSIEISLNARGRFEGELLSLETSFDVPPVANEPWRIPELNREVKRLALTQLGDRWYGHGLHKKSALIMSLFALRVIKEEKLKLHNRLSVSVYNHTRAEPIEPKPYRLALEQNCADSGQETAALSERSRWVGVLDRLLTQYSSTGSGSQRRLTAGGANCTELRLSKSTSEFESKDIDGFLSDFQLVTEALLRLGQMKGLNRLK